MSHDPTCTSCPSCDPDRWQLRTGIAYEEDTNMESYKPPDSYRVLADAPPTDEARAIAAELRRRDLGFMRVVSVNATGGTYEAYEHGRGTVVKKFTLDANGVATPEFAPAQNAVTAAELKTAAANEELARFAAEWGRNQIAERETEYHAIAEADARAAEASERLGVPVSQLRIAVDHDDIPPAPNGYDIALKALRESGR